MTNVLEDRTICESQKACAEACPMQMCIRDRHIPYRQTIPARADKRPYRPFETGRTGCDTHDAERDFRSYSRFSVSYTHLRPERAQGW